MDAAIRISLGDAHALILDALRANGVADEFADPVASALVAAEAEGQVGHGFSRLPDYVAQVRTGKINPSPKISSQQTSQSGIVTDADCGFAYPALDRAIAWGCKTAKSYGCATMSIFNSHHCGALSIQVEKLADAGLIAIMMANAPKAIAPWGAREPFFGTNPIAFAAPRKSGPPLVIDLSLSVVARGKVMNAHKLGEDIPEGWALDKDGNHTTDAEAALAGSMLPIGGAKGTALALMVEIMVTALAGGAFSHEASSFFSADGPPPRVGQFLMAISPGTRSNQFLSRIEELLQQIAAQPGARLPGERRLRSRAEAEKDGLLVPAPYIDAAKALARGGQG